MRSAAESLYAACPAVSRESGAPAASLCVLVQCKARGCSLLAAAAGLDLAVGWDKYYFILSLNIPLSVKENNGKTTPQA